MRPNSRLLRSIKYAAVPLVAVLVGVAVAVASSPASLSRGHTLGTPVQPSPTPSVTGPGILGKSPQLVASGIQSLVGITPNRAVSSTDGGKTWSTLVPPATGSGIAMDPANPHRGITGGSSIQFTADGGASWRPALVPPPGGGPFQVLAVSPFDGKVWFFLHQTKLLRTRDASTSWRDIPGLPALSNPVMTAGTAFGEFFLTSGNRVFDLIDNGQQVNEQAPLPSGVSVAALAAIGGGPASVLARTANGVLYMLQGTQWLTASGAPGGPIAAGGTGVVLVGDGGAKLGSPGSINYSFDAGATWHQGTGLPYDQSVEAIAGQPTSTTFFAYCYGGDIYTSSDGGRAWTVLTRSLRSRSG